MFRNPFIDQNYMNQYSSTLVVSYTSSGISTVAECLHLIYTFSSTTNRPYDCSEKVRGKKNVSSSAVRSAAKRPPGDERRGGGGRHYRNDVVESKAILSGRSGLLPASSAAPPVCETRILDTA
ncbi:hypothetical protein EVAR_76729_1 [Eumeta japonica]|uniref:Uncharacterized protein n=1 Tax=Eumeta variegata TaxID=151549 RepID=A0A4C1SSY4_EUMVA|nr:hypothetical protein EVAR_76729_1 [Eumeta japonica]